MFGLWEGNEGGQQNLSKTDRSFVLLIIMVIPIGFLFTVL